MKLGARLALGALFLLALGAAVGGTRLVQALSSQGLLGQLHFEPGRRRSATLTDETRARLASFDEEVRLSYYVTRREELPAHLAHLEERVRDVLEAFAGATAGQPLPFRVEIVYPGEHPEWAASLASAGLAPWRARRVEGDGYRDDELWSSLRIGLGARPSAVFNGLGPQQVSELQRLILAQLEQLRAPRRPLVALDAPEQGFDQLRAILKSGAQVVEVELEDQASLPEGTDLFLWLDPEQAGEAQLAAVERLMARGGSLLFAGHRTLPRERWQGEELSVRFEEGSDASRTVLAHFGLTPLDGLLLDPRGGKLVGPASKEGAEPPSKIVPWTLRATPDNQDFRTLPGQPNGSLIFATPEAFVPDPLRLGELGLEATVLAGASELASLAPPPTEELGVDAIYELSGRPEPHAALAAILRPADPWSGRLVALGDSSCLQDAWLGHEDHAHLALLEILLSHLTSDERMVAARIALEGAEVLPELEPGTRAALRLAVVFALPGLLALLFLLRGRAARGRGARVLPPMRPVLAGVVALALALFASALAPELDADLTRDGRNRLTPEEAATFEALLTKPVELELAFSSPERLPPEFKPLAREVRRTCADLARRFDALELRDLRPDGADAAARAELARAGIAPLAVGTTSAEGARLFRPYAHLRLRGEFDGDEREEVLAFPSLRAFGDLRFRLAHALARLARGAPTRLALFAEPPRLSPAEAALEYQRKGLFAPREGDAFSELAGLLTDFDFQVERLDPRREAIPGESDAVLWMQPRRDVLPMLEQLAGWLSSGGGALVAGQHFRIRSRQLEGAALEQRFWPEPQFLDLEQHYLPALGIDLPREVLFDSRHGSLALDTRVDAVDGDPTYRKLETTQPFLVEGVAGGAGPLPEGQYLLPFAARIELDAERLAGRGLEATTWLAGSSSAWSYAWAGGDLAPEVLTGPRSTEASADEAPADEDGPAPRALARPPILATWIEGPFPAATVVTSRESGRRELSLDEGALGSEDGRLLLVGDAELFSNDVLTLADHDHGLLALRAAAELCLAPELSSLLRQERGAPPIAAQADSTRFLWRLVVLGAFPLLLCLLGLWRRVRA